MDADEDDQGIGAVLAPFARDTAPHHTLDGLVMQVTDRAFDDFAVCHAAAAANRRLLGIKE